jgi:uncharacterized protein YgiM (DUF1202 family)
MFRRIWLVCCVMTLALIVLSACGRGRSEPTPTPTKTPDSAQTGQSGAAPEAATPTPPAAAGATTAAPSAPAPAAEAPTATPATKAVVVINAPILNVRRTPAADGELVQTVEQGEQYDVIGRSQDGSWVQIGTDGREVGWVSTEFVLEQTVAVEPAAPTGDTAETPGEAPAAEGQAPATGSGNYLPATMSSPDFGGQAFLWWKPEIADRDLSLMKEANFRWVKQTFAWETIEGAGKGVYDWSIADRVVTHVNEHGLKLLARVSSDPEEATFWAGPPPANGDNYADFLFALASRYNCTPQAVGCIQAYQIWNEPNLAREWGGAPPNPAQYVEFLRKAYAAIKRANPNAIVINAGMAPTGDNSAVAMADDLFYDGMYQAMGGNSDGYFDMLGVHGAGFAAPPELDPAEAAADPKYGGYRFFAFRHVEDIRAIMERYGDSDKKIVLLEFGWTYDPVNASYKWHGADAGITDMVQGDYLRRAYQYATANWPWIGLMSLLTMPNLDWMNDGNPQDEEQYWWAILEPSQIDQLQLRPAFVILCDYFNDVEGRQCKYEPQ